MRKKIKFTILFVILGLLGSLVPVVKLEGSRSFFTLFDFFAPIAGGLIGAGLGMVSVLSVKLITTLTGAGFVDIGSVIRLFPTLFGVWYFARKDRNILFVPLLAMLAFNLHPIGRIVWYYSLFWLIPVAMHFVRDRFLLARALGATFTAHSVGGAAWIWALNLPAGVWVGLIPQVALERSMMAVGIAIMYQVMVNVLHVMQRRWSVKLPLALDKRYILSFLK